jgi:hypothetical protein
MTMNIAPYSLYRAHNHVKIKVSRAKRIKCTGVWLPIPGQHVPNHHTIWGEPLLHTIQ